MSIFGQLRDAIFGTRSPATPQAPPAQTPAAASSSAPASGRPAVAGSPSGSSPGTRIDIGEVLRAKAASKPEKLNWQTSIVDLMKLVDLDPTLENRKALASELGYTGDTKDTASMNMWLHKRVMEELAAAGGKVPDDLRGH
jgi:Domain of unknown function (DUF3597)